MTQWNEQVAIVTGAGSGIGQGLSHALASRGVTVVACDINPERIEATQKEIEAAGGKAVGVTLDVTDADAVAAVVRDTHERHGRIDYIFNNAGIAVGGEVRDVELEDWQKVLKVNLDGVVHGVVAAYPIMVDQGFGHIINTASIEGLAPFPSTVSYVASKHAVVGLSTSLRVEGADLGVKVSAVCPGYIKTRIFEDSKFVGMDVQEEIDNMPAWLGITPDECAKRILRGVERNKAIIPITGMAWVLWALMRVSPNAVIALMRRQLRHARIRLRNVEPKN
jgi:NADP-dependent 3-hydroxy acid dehydrogenase YdfG